MGERTGQAEEKGLSFVLMSVKKRIGWILLAGVLGFVGSLLYSRFLVVPQYTSTALLYVVPKEGEVVRLPDLEMGTQLTEDYKVLISGRFVLQSLIQALDLQTDYEQIKRKVEVRNPKGTRILELSVSDAQPEMAKKMADELAALSMTYISQVMDMQAPKLIESANLPTVPSAPHVPKILCVSTVFALFCGTALSVLTARRV